MCGSSQDTELAAAPGVQQVPEIRTAGLSARLQHTGWFTVESVPFLLDECDLTK